MNSKLEAKKIEFHQKSLATRWHFLKDRNHNTFLFVNIHEIHFAQNSSVSIFHVAMCSDLENVVIFRMGFPQLMLVPSERKEVRSNFVAIFLLFFVCIKSGKVVPNDVADKRYTKIWVLCFLFLFGLLSSFVRQ